MSQLMWDESKNSHNSNKYCISITTTHTIRSTTHSRRVILSANTNIKQGPWCYTRWLESDLLSDPLHLYNSAALVRVVLDATSHTWSWWLSECLFSPLKSCGSLTIVIIQFVRSQCWRSTCGGWGRSFCGWTWACRGGPRAYSKVQAVQLLQNQRNPYSQSYNFLQQNTYDNLRGVKSCATW